jgi:hypothetical protein
VEHVRRALVVDRRDALAEEPFAAARVVSHGPKSATGRAEQVSRDATGDLL